MTAAPKDSTRRERERTRRLFNRAAPAFLLIDRVLAPQYRAVLASLDLPIEFTVLDLGAGTGTLAAAFAARGHVVTGIETAERLLRRAARRVPRAEFMTMDLVDLPRLESRSFDLVSLGFVLHGLPPPLRRSVLAEAARIAAHSVLVIDHVGRGPWHLRFVEWLEGPHYPSFVAEPFERAAVEAGLEVERTVPLSASSTAWLLRPSTSRDR